MSILVKAVAWLTHVTLLDALTNAAVGKLDGELTIPKTKTNEKLEMLKARFPNEGSENLTVTESHNRVAVQLQRFDTYHGLNWDGPKPVLKVFGLKVGP
jgi:hypothetical protein